MSLADEEVGRDPARASGAAPAISRSAAVAELISAVQTPPGHVVVLGKDAQAAARLFDEAEAQLAIHRSVRVRGRTLDGNAAVAALCADKTQGGGLAEWQRAAMQALVNEARAAGLPVVFVVTEADAVDAGRLERFCQTVECATGATEVIRMVLLGGPRLVRIVQRQEGRSPTMRIAAIVRAPGADAAERKSRVRLPAVLAGRYAHAAALGGAVVLATLMFATKIFPRGEQVAGPPSTPPATEAAPMREPAPPEPPPEAHEEAPAAAPSPPAQPRPEPAAATPPATRAPAPPSPPSKGPALQVGAFLSAASAEALRQRLAPQFGGAYVSTVDRNGSTYHRVRVAGFTSEADLRAAETALRAAGYAPIRARD